MKKIFALSAFIALLAGCQPQASNSIGSTTPTDLQHHRFELVKFNKQPIVLSKESPFTLEFNENMTFNGQMCNNFRGQATLVDGLLKATTPLMMTRKLCSDKTLNQLDIAINTLFTHGARVTHSSNTLTLSNTANTLVFKLSDLIN